jgi:hypothetical protein
MKIQSRRTAISQSLDLFIIIGAVLAVGGIVTSSVFGLVNGNAQSTAMQITAISAAGSAPASSTGLNSFMVTLKNIGSAAISGTLTITLAGTSGNTGASLPNPVGSTTNGSTVTSLAAHGGTVGSPVTLTATVTLQPGGLVAISEGAVSGLTTGWSTGVVQSVSVTMGVASATATVIS